MTSLFALFLFANAPIGPADDSDRPPKLTFEKKIDYVAWWNARMREGKDNAFELYSLLSGAEDAEGVTRGGLPLMDDEEGRQFDGIRWRAWKEKDYPALAKRIRDSEKFLEIFVSASKHKDYWQHTPSDTDCLFHLKARNLMGVRTATKLLLAQAWIETEKQGDRLAIAHDAVLRSAAHMQNGGEVTNLMLGLLCREMSYDSLMAAAHRSAIQERDSTTIYAHVQRFDPGMPDFDRVLTGEWAMILDGLQYFCPNAVPDPTRISSNGLRRSDGDIAGREAALKTFVPSAAAAKIDSMFEQSRKLVQGPVRYSKARAVSRVFDSALKERTDDPILQAVLINAGRILELSVRAESRRCGTMLTLAILAHHHKHGEYPKSLDDIDPKLGLKDLKNFKIDPMTGKQFRYALKDGKPLLYSVGVDGKDDGGRHDEKFGDPQGGDYVFWPYPRRD